MTTGKTIALTRWTFVDKVMSLLFNMLSRLVITFLPRSLVYNFLAYGISSLCLRVLLNMQKPSAISMASHPGPRGGFSIGTEAGPGPAALLRVSAFPCSFIGAELSNMCVLRGDTQTTAGPPSSYKARVCSAESQNSEHFFQYKNLQLLKSDS